MAEEIKAGGESSWWQGDCKPNRTRTVTAILESAMNKEEGQEERLSERKTKTETSFSFRVLG